MSETPPVERAAPPTALVAAACFVAFFVLGSYELVRSPIDSLFVAAHGSQALPKVWILVALGAIATTALYNRFAATNPILTMLRACIVVSAVALVALLVGLPFAGPLLVYVLYVWKDVYIVVLVEAFWTLANASFGTGTAKWVYGVFCAAGSFGGMTANALGETIALEHGTVVEVWLAVPVLGVALALTWLLRTPGETVAPRTGRSASFGYGVSILRRSRVLTLMLVMVLSVQLVVTLVDFQFQAAAERAFIDTDARTAALHSVYFWISAGAMTMQLLSGAVLKFLGVAGTLLAIPAIISATVLGILVSPVFAVAAAAKVLGKVLDYSVFRTAKEVLYIGLSRGERTEGKAIVDILTYRVAKGGASLLLQGLILLGALTLAPWLACVFVITWLAAAILLARDHRSETKTLPTD